MQFSYRSLICIIVFVIECVVVSAASADDTEVYGSLASDQSSVKPNVLFIIDTSGSMDTEITTTVPYDSSETYSGNCTVGRIYWTTGGGTPSCHTSNYFNASALVCAAAQDPLFGSGASGYYLDRMAQWRQYRRNSTRWRAISSSDKDNYVECKADQGKHGIDDTSTAKWIKNSSSGPWIDTAHNATNWNSVGDQTTLYSGNYLNWYNSTNGGTTTQTRLQIVDDVTSNLVNSMHGVNVGLMRFDKSNQGDNRHNEGGPVIYPVSDIDAGTNRSDIDNTIAQLDNPVGSTPLAETYWEAKLYYSGETPLFGDDSKPPSSSLSKNRDGTYKSPIVNACGKNYIVYLTDGVPEYDNSANSEINAALSNTSGLTDTTCDPDGTRHYANDSCFDELAEYLYKTDSNSDLDGKQNVITYTVGFDESKGVSNVDVPLLTSAAHKGGGAFYLVGSAQELSSAFNEVINRILSVNTTFTSPAVTVNAFNRLVNNNDIYFTIFRPSDRTHWDGNVKRYKLGFASDDQQDITILDANDQLAVDPQTGFFADDSRSYWTLGTAPDGKEARLGGLADRLYNFVNDDHVAASRNVYTYTGITKTLSDSTNKVTESNAQTAANTDGNLTKAMFDVTDQSDAQFVDLVKWASGVDLSDDDEDSSITDGRPIIGAPLHSKPVIVTYGTRGTSDDPYQDDALFVTTNDGYFHAVSNLRDLPASTNKLEDFAYLPPDQLSRLDALKTDAEASNIQYGLDGSLEIWMDDANHDGGVEDNDGTLQSGEHVYVYFGERRGGRVYHALDVTDRANPKLLWTIDPSSAGPNDPFNRLGQTWSKPVHRQMEISGTTKDVVIFGGGYDTGHDEAAAARDDAGDAEGNALYIVDATTGELLWWASDSPVGTTDPDLTIAGLKYSIPAGVRAVDTNSDGLTDTILVGDTGGQLLRFDVTSSGITGGVIADLQIAAAGDTALAADNRMFYETPDVTLVEPAGKDPYLTIAIGSGYRAHPLDKTVNDRIYVLRAPVSGITSYTTLYQGDLLDVTSLITDAQFEALTDDQNDALKNGWYIRLEGPNNEASGEKVLAESLTLGGRMLFTTYIPPDQSVSIDQQSCAPNQGTGRLYIVNFLTGQPVVDLDGIVGTSLAKTDRYESLSKPGIPPDPVAVVPNLGDGSHGVILVGPQVVDGNGRTFTRSYWYENNVHE